MIMRWVLLSGALATALVGTAANAQPQGRSSDGSSKQLEKQIESLKAKIKQIEADLAKAMTAEKAKSAQKGRPQRSEQQRGGPGRGRSNWGGERGGWRHNGDYARGRSRDWRRGPRGFFGRDGHRSGQKPGSSSIEQKLDRMQREIDELKRANKKR